MRQIARNPAEKKTNLTTKAYREIKDAITRNELKQGDCLSENELAKRFGMSRTPVREAIRSLANEGLVEVHNGVGIFVRHITNREVLDVFEVRANLECLALQSAVSHITDAEIAAQEAHWREFARRLDAGETIDHRALTALDHELHGLIVERCENEFLKEIVRDISTKVRRLQHISFTSLSNTQLTIRQHMEIISHLKQRDVAKLAPVLKSHIQQSARYIVDRNIL